MISLREIVYEKYTKLLLENLRTRFYNDNAQLIEQLENLRKDALEEQKKC